MAHTYDGPNKIEASVLFEKIPGELSIRASLDELAQGLERLKNSRKLKDQNCSLRLSINLEK